MLNLIKMLRGDVAYNKFKIWMWTAQRNPFANLVATFINRFYFRWNNTDKALEVWVKVAMVVIPLLNIFIFRSMFSFILIVLFDIAFVSFVMATKIVGWKWPNI